MNMEKDNVICLKHHKELKNEEYKKKQEKLWLTFNEKVKNLQEDGKKVNSFYIIAITEDSSGEESTYIYGKYTRFEHINRLLIAIECVKNFLVKEMCEIFDVK